MTWEPGESPPNRHENCDTPFELFYSHSVGHSADDDKLPTLYVKLQGDYTFCVYVDIQMKYQCNVYTNVSLLGTNNGRLDQLSYETMIPLDTLQGYLELVCYIVYCVGC